MSYFSAAPERSHTWKLGGSPKATIGRIGRNASIALAYFILAALSTNFQFGGVQVGPLCIPCGFGLAVTLRYGYAATTGIFVGAFCAATLRYGIGEHPEFLSVQHLLDWTGNSASLFLISAKSLGATIEAALGAFLIRTLHRRDEIFNSIIGVFYFCFAALVASGIASTLSTGAQVASGFIPPEQISSIWLVRWLGHLSGIFVLAPFLTACWPPVRLRPSSRHSSSFLVGGLALIGVAMLSQISLNYWNTPYVLFPVLLLIAFRFGPLAATTSIVIVAISSVIATAQGNGLFVRPDPIESMILLQGFISVISVTVLFLDAALSERRGAFAEAKLVLERFKTLFESVPVGVVAIDAKGKILHANIQSEKMFGYGRGELDGLAVEHLLPGDSRALHAKLRERYTKDPHMRAMGVGRELFGLRKDGTNFPVEIGLAPCRDSESPLILASVVDISERKEAERLHQGLLRRMWGAIDAERLRLAHELHDETGQNVTAVMLELRRIEQELSGEERIRLHRLRSQLDEMAKSLHRIAWQLRPLSIEELGLRNALENYVSDWSEKSGIRGDFHCREEKIDELGEELRTIIYRVVQEALTNVAKHAMEAANASVVIDGDRDMLRLTIEDNGRGFDLSQTKTQWPKGLGLAGMRERLSVVRGELNIESTPGLGTTLFIRIPRSQELAA